MRSELLPGYDFTDLFDFSSRIYLRSGYEPVGQSALLLDRDGVLNEDFGYVGQAERVVVLPGVASEVRRSNQASQACFIVTNQSGIGRGYFSWDDFEVVTNVIMVSLACAGAWIDGIAVCAASPLASSCTWRKPRPGMIRGICEVGSLETSRSWLVGDRETDIVAAAAAELSGAVFVSNNATQAKILKVKHPKMQVESAPTAASAIRAANYKLSMLR